MKALLNIFRRNLGLKLIALVLSLVIYYSMRKAPGGTAKLPDAPLFLKGPADGGSGK